MTWAIEAVPITQCDYSFQATHEDEGTSGSGAGFSTVVDRKGPSESAVKGGFRVLDQPRHAAVILQPDPENAAGAPVEEIGQRSA